MMRMICHNWYNMSRPNFCNKGHNRVMKIMMAIKVLLTEVVIFVCQLTNSQVTRVFLKTSSFFSMLFNSVSG